MLQRPTPATNKPAVKESLTIVVAVAAVLLLVVTFGLSFASHCEGCRAEGTSYLPSR